VPVEVNRSTYCQQFKVEVIGVYSLTERYTIEIKLLSLNISETIRDRHLVVKAKLALRIMILT